MVAVFGIENALICSQLIIAVGACQTLSGRPALKGLSPPQNVTHFGAHRLPLTVVGYGNVLLFVLLAVADEEGTVAGLTTDVRAPPACPAPPRQRRGGAEGLRWIRRGGGARVRALRDERRAANLPAAGHPGLLYCATTQGALVQVQLTSSAAPPGRAAGCD